MKNASLFELSSPVYSHSVYSGGVDIDDVVVNDAPSAE